MMERLIWCRAGPKIPINDNIYQGREKIESIFNLNFYLVNKMNKVIGTTIIDEDI